MNITLPPGSVMQCREFIFGVATSSFQIEGGAENRLPSIWDTFCGTPGKIRDSSDGRIACDHYSRWREDVDLISGLGVDAYRFSISWPRVIRRDGSLNEEGIGFYLHLLDRLNEKNIKPFVTLYHWDLPQYLEDQGGWLNRDTAFRFRDYADLVTRAFGQRVFSYATLNEPFCSAFFGYETGRHAPGLVDRSYGKKAAHNLLLAHGLAMKVLDQNSPDSLNGIVLNFTTSYPATDGVEDQLAASLADEIHNQWFIRPLLEGRYPDLIESLPEVELPVIHEGDLKTISHRLDFLGINYYTRAVYRADDKRTFVPIRPTLMPLTEMGWEVYPPGFTDLLVSLNSRYDLPPVYITENGAAMVDTIEQGEIKDRGRIQYFQQHLEALSRAIEQGIDIRGYFAWSFMDNFEWAEGYEKRFGLVYVDYPTQSRTLKASGQAYRDMLTRRRQDT